MKLEDLLEKINNELKEAYLTTPIEKYEIEIEYQKDNLTAIYFYLKDEIEINHQTKTITLKAKH